MILIYRGHAVLSADWAKQHGMAVNRILRPMGVRRCAGCKMIKGIAHFTKAAGGQCRGCHAARTRRWESKNPATSKAAQAARSARRRALERSLSVPGCPVTGPILAAKLEYWAHRCWLCSRPVTLSDLAWDHVKPLSARGPHILANLRPSHGHCNRVKGASHKSVTTLA